MTHATRALQSHDLLGERINSGSHNTFLTIRGHGGPQSRGYLHESHAHIHSNEANMNGWLWRPNDIRGPCGPKASCHLSYRWGKTTKKPHSGNLSRPGIEPGPAAWQARMLPPAPQNIDNYNLSCSLNVYPPLNVHNVSQRKSGEREMALNFVETVLKTAFLLCSSIWNLDHNYFVVIITENSYVYFLMSIIHSQLALTLSCYIVPMRLIM